MLNKREDCMEDKYFITAIVCVVISLIIAFVIILSQGSEINDIKKQVEDPYVGEIYICRGYDNFCYMENSEWIKIRKSEVYKVNGIKDGIVINGTFISGDEYFLYDDIYKEKRQVMYAKDLL